jgi:hypothetical protein
MPSLRKPLVPARFGAYEILSFPVIFLVLLLVWFIINFIQATNMEILSDETYYKLFSEKLDWGYYDHPPMIALMVKISSFFFAGNLGIRFLTVVLQIFTLLFTWMTIEKEKGNKQIIYTFFIVAGSIFMFTGYGVITTPDAPLLFFTALFLFTYKRFIHSPKWSVTFLFGFAMAALIYSKYHAVLVIGFTVLSNLTLLRRPRFWAATLLALILIIPHCYWQYSHDFPSLQYHLAYRLENFQIMNVLEFLPNQMILLNPFTMGAVAFVLIIFAPSDLFYRCLSFQIFGFYAFFLLISLRDHVEPNWTIPCAIPIIIILSERISTNQALFKYSRRFILPSIALVLAGRIVLVCNNDLSRLTGYSGKKDKYEFMGSETGNLPVVFVGSYQRPSLYHFFTGKEGFVISSLFSRQTQFDIWQFEKKYHNKRVFISIAEDKRSRVFRKGSVSFRGFISDSLQTVNRMQIKYELKKNTFHPLDSIKISFSIRNTYDYSIDFHHPDFPVKVCLVLIGKNKKDIYVLDASLSKAITVIKSKQVSESSLFAEVPHLPFGEYKMTVSLSNTFGPSFNSKFSNICILEK